VVEEIAQEGREGRMGVLFGVYGVKRNTGVGSTTGTRRRSYRARGIGCATCLTELMP
jgi:hypothetical protein